MSRPTLSAHDHFLTLLPAIQRTIRCRLSQAPLQEREELHAEALAAAFQMCCQLADENRLALAYASPLAHFGVRRALDGRQVGTRANSRDIGSRACQQRTGLQRQSLGSPVMDRGQWQELVVEDRRATPADVAATRIDFRDWLGTLTGRRRRIAETLATGETTQATARKFRVSPGRISQLRRELQAAWQQFQGELVPHGA